MFQKRAGLPYFKMPDEYGLTINLCQEDKHVAIAKMGCISAMAGLQCNQLRWSLAFKR